MRSQWPFIRTSVRLESVGSLWIKQSLVVFHCSSFLIAELYLKTCEASSGTHRANVRATVWAKAPVWKLNLIRFRKTKRCNHIWVSTAPVPRNLPESFLPVESYSFCLHIILNAPANLSYLSNWIKCLIFKYTGNVLPRLDVDLHFLYTAFYLTAYWNMQLSRRYNYSTFSHILLFFMG